ncbi:indole-3-glycerol phosphate synthase TrpC [Lachnospiraceae bacterium ZAX-1]
MLEEIADYTRERINEKKKRIPFEEMVDLAQQANAARDLGDDGTNEPFRFEKALRTSDISFIGEVKKASPTKGIIAEQFPYVQIAKEYEAAGIAAISVLTEPHYFKGSDSYFTQIAKEVSTPLLRKDFTVDPYMIYEAKVMGASAVLLICALLGDELTAYLQTAHRLGLSALVETHTKQEIESAVKADARIIGVNNRDLKTFTVDVAVSERLRPYVPKDKIFLSESGIQTPQDIKRLRAIGTDAVLIGETFMRSTDKAAELLKLRGSC